MIDTLIISMAVLLVPMVISRFMMEKALGKLDGEMKLKLLNGFSGKGKYSLLIVLPVLFVYLFSLKFFPDYSMGISALFLVVFLVFFINRNIKNYKLIKSLDVPKEYQNTFKKSIAVVLLGFICFGVQLFFAFLADKEENSNRYKAWESATKGYDEAVKKDYKNSIIDFSKAIALDSTESSYFKNRGTSYYYDGRMDEAAEDWRKAILLGDPSAGEYLKLLMKK